MSLSARNITVDCVAPRDLATWWATALGGEIVEDFDGGNEFCVSG